MLSLLVENININITEKEGREKMETLLNQVKSSVE